MFYTKVRGYRDQGYQSWVRSYFRENKQFIAEMNQQNLFPTYGDFVYWSIKTSTEANLHSPYEVLPVLNTSLGINRYLSECGDGYNFYKEVELYRVNDVPLIMSWVAKLANLSNIPMPSKMGALFITDQIFSDWFAEAFFTVLKVKTNEGIFDYREDDSAVHLDKLIMDEHWGEGFNELMNCNNEFLKFMIGSYLQRIQKILIPEVKKTLLRLQVFNSYDYANIVASWEKTRSLRGYYEENFESSISRNKYILQGVKDCMNNPLTLNIEEAKSKAEKSKNSIPVRGVTVPKVFFSQSNKNKMQEIAEKSNIVSIEVFKNSSREINEFCEVYELPKKMSANDYAAKLEKQREAQLKAKQKNVQVKCLTPLKNTFVTIQLAEEFIAANHPEDPYLRPYPCPCGALHIGHKHSYQKPFHLRKFD